MLLSTQFGGLEPLISVLVSENKIRIKFDFGTRIKTFQEIELELVSQFHLCVELELEVEPIPNFLKIKKKETITGGYREVNCNYLTSNYFNSDNSKFRPIFRIETGMFCWKKSRPRI